MQLRACWSGLLGCLLATCFSLAFASTVAAAPFVYVANLDGGISQYAVSGSGWLDPLAPPTVPIDGSTRSVAVSPDGRSLYATDVVGYSAGRVLQFDIAAGGRLLPKLPATVPARAVPSDLLVSPDGRSVYVSNPSEEWGRSPRLSQYDVGPHGELTPKRPASFRSGCCGTGAIVASPDGESVYLTHSTAYGILRYRVGRGGRLGPVRGGRLVPADSAPDASGSWDIAVSPDGRNLYAAGNGIAQFDVRRGGGLSPRGPATIGGHRLYNRIVVSPDGRSVYASFLSANGYVGDKVAQFDVAGNGRLIPKDPPRISTGTFPDGLAVTPDGRRLYVANRDDDAISQYAIRSDGTLERMAPPPVAAGDEPRAVAVTPRPTTRDGCKQLGWRWFGFGNQRRCLYWFTNHR